MKIRVETFNPGNREDFFEFHSRVGGECFCTAWWVPTWEEWSKTTAASNRQTRMELLTKGEFDGYLIYADDQAVGWCQVGLRDRLAKVLEQFNLTIDPKTWAITCFQIDPQFQKTGLASQLLSHVLDHLQKKGVERVEVYPKLNAALPANQHWTGPLLMYQKAGFSKVRKNKSRAVYAISLQASAANAENSIIGKALD